jgi:hypothetical protein
MSSVAVRPASAIDTGSHCRLSLQTSTTPQAREAHADINTKVRRAAGSRRRNADTTTMSSATAEHNVAPILWRIMTPPANPGCDVAIANSTTWRNVSAPAARPTEATITLRSNFHLPTLSTSLPNGLAFSCERQEQDNRRLSCCSRAGRAELQRMLLGASTRARDGTTSTGTPTCARQLQRLVRRLLRA